MLIDNVDYLIEVAWKALPLKNRVKRIANAPIRTGRVVGKSLLGMIPGGASVADNIYNPKQPRGFNPSTNLSEPSLKTTLKNTAIAGATSELSKNIPGIGLGVNIIRNGANEAVEIAKAKHELDRLRDIKIKAESNVRNKYDITSNKESLIDTNQNRFNMAEKRKNQICQSYPHLC